MKCESCQHEFCWLCLGHYPAYKHQDVDNGAVCGHRTLVGVSFMLICFFTVWIKVTIAMRDLAKTWLGWEINPFELNIQGKIWWMV